MRETMTQASQAYHPYAPGTNTSPVETKKTKDEARLEAHSEFLGAQAKFERMLMSLDQIDVVERLTSDRFKKERNQALASSFRLVDTKDPHAIEALGAMVTGYDNTSALIVVANAFAPRGETPTFGDRLVQAATEIRNGKTVEEVGPKYNLDVRPFVNVVPQAALILKDGFKIDSLPGENRNLTGFVWTLERYQVPKR
jgi:hypothetical protein